MRHLLRILTTISVILFIIIFLTSKILTPSKVNLEPKTLLEFGQLKTTSDAIIVKIASTSNMPLIAKYNSIAKTANNIIDVTIGAIKNNSSKKDMEFINNSIHNDLNPQLQFLSKQMNNDQNMHNLVEFKINIINLDVDQLYNDLLIGINPEAKNYYIDKLNSYRWKLI